MNDRRPKMVPLDPRDMMKGRALANRMFPEADEVDTTSSSLAISVERQGGEVDVMRWENVAVTTREETWSARAAYWEDVFKTKRAKEAETFHSTKSGDEAIEQALKWLKRKIQ